MKSHRFDALSFIFGALFALFGLIFLIAGSPWELLVVDFRWGWLGPALLIGLGIIILLPMFRSKDQPVAHPGPAPDHAGDGLIDELGDETEALQSAQGELPPQPFDS